jgi:hypothetical protein
MLLDRLINFFTSLKLTFACLVLATVLVFIGTLAQVDMGLYKVQAEFFRSFVIHWGPKGAGWKIPVFPGGYLIGGVLLINLVAAHFKRFGFSRAQIPSILTHGGLILLLLGQLGTDMLSTESGLHLRVGETRNFSESDRLTELAVVDLSDPATEKVVTIPDSWLARSDAISHPELPFTIHVKRFLPNSTLSDKAELGFEQSPATQGVSGQVWVKELPAVTKMDSRNMPAAILELRSPQGSLGTWLVSPFLDAPQSVTCNNRPYNLALRLRRYYQPFTLQLLDFRHDVYAGTDIPKNFSSRVRLRNPPTGEDREVLIYMNNPLRYTGLTFYQASLDPDNQGSILQVVRNPSWLTPYFACLLVSAGLTLQFVLRLLNFLRNRRTL